MGVGIWGKKHSFIHSRRFKIIIKQQDTNIIESKTDSLLDMQSTDSLRNGNGKVLQSKIVCHTTALAEVSSLKSKQDLDSKKDISPTAQYDKVLEFKQNLISKQNLESCNFAPLRPAPTHLDKNLESKNCHIERSEISSQDSKRDFSLSLKMTRKHKMTKMLFSKMTSKQKTTNIKKRFFAIAQNDKKTQNDKNAFSQNDKIIQTENVSKWAYMQKRWYYVYFHVCFMQKCRQMALRFKSKA